MSCPLRMWSCMGEGPWRLSRGQKSKLPKIGGPSTEIFWVYEHKCHKLISVGRNAGLQNWPTSYQHYWLSHIIQILAPRAGTPPLKTNMHMRRSNKFDTISAELEAPKLRQLILCQRHLFCVPPKRQHSQGRLKSMTKE